MGGTAEAWVEAADEAFHAVEHAFGGFVAGDVVIGDLAHSMFVRGLQHYGDAVLVSGGEFADDGGFVESGVVDANTAFDGLVVGDLVGDEGVGALELVNLRGDGGLMVFEDLAALLGCGVAQLAQLGVALQLADGHVGGAHAMQEVKPGGICLRVAPMAVAGTADGLDEPHTLVVAEGVGGHAAVLCHGANGIARSLHDFNVHLGARSKSRMVSAHGTVQTV